MASRGLKNNRPGSNTAVVIGIDLAWGSRQPDAIAMITASAGLQPLLTLTPSTSGDDDLLAAIEKNSAGAENVLVAVDAPIICRNATGARPVDRLSHRIFHRQHAACHPANLSLCARPAALGPKLEAAGFHLDWNLALKRIAFEVYPHPATIRWFELDRIVKYKRGPVAARREEFARLQTLTSKLLEDFQLDVAPEAAETLRLSWKKPIEDALDSILCALIGWNHWLHRGSNTEVLGDKGTGFILIPSGPASRSEMPS